MKEQFDIFPYEWSDKWGTHVHTGLIARDYIAIHAMQGLLANPAAAGVSYDEIADMAYKQAKAMLKKSEAGSEK